MSHFDAVTEVPAGFAPTATPTPRRAFEDPAPAIWAVQFHHRGRAHAERAACSSVRARPRRMRADVDDGLLIDSRSRRCASRSRQACDLRPERRVDSAVARALVHRGRFGPQLNVRVTSTRGSCAAARARQVVETFPRNMGMRAESTSDAGGPFLRYASPGVPNPEEKRKAIGELFVRSSRSTPAADRRRVPRAGHALPGRRSRAAASTARPPSSRATTTSGSAGGHDAPARRAAARAVQGRGAPTRQRARSP
jgi:hypothetical protein